MPNTDIQNYLSMFIGNSIIGPNVAHHDDILQMVFDGFLNQTTVETLSQKIMGILPDEARMVLNEQDVLGFVKMAYDQLLTQDPASFSLASNSKLDGDQTVLPFSIAGNLDQKGIKVQGEIAGLTENILDDRVNLKWFPVKAQAKVSTTGISISGEGSVLNATAVMPEELKDVSVSLDVGAVKAGAGYDLVKQKVSQKAWAALAKLNLGLDQISLPNGCVLDASLSLALGAIGRETSIKPHDVTFFIGAGQFGAGGHLQWECAPMDSLSPQ